MIKNTYNLKKLCSKLEHRYGVDDDLVMELKRELEAREVLESRRNKFFMPYADFIQSWHASLMKLSFK